MVQVKFIKVKIWCDDVLFLTETPVKVSHICWLSWYRNSSSHSSSSWDLIASWT